MSSSSMPLDSSSSSNYSIDSSILEFKGDKKEDILQYRQEHQKLKELTKKGKNEKAKMNEKKNKNIESRKEFIERKKKEKKNLLETKNIKKTKANECLKSGAPTKECMKCHKIIKAKNFFYHDAFIHNGENLNFYQRKRALNTYITKKIKKIDIIFSDIMSNAKRLKIDTFNSPEMIHIEKIGYHVIKFNEKKGKK